MGNVSFQHTFRYLLQNYLESIRKVKILLAIKHIGIESDEGKEKLTRKNVMQIPA